MKTKRFPDERPQSYAGSPTLMGCSVGVNISMELSWRELTSEVTQYLADL